MSLKRLIDFSLGLCCYLLAVSMFFYFPGVENWTFSTIRPDMTPSAFIYALLNLLVVLPAVFGPTALAVRARSYARPVLMLCCLSLAALFALAGAGYPLLYGRVALLALLTGQLLALGRLAGNSVPYNWMAYLAFILANFTFPDSPILAAANFSAGAYLLCAGLLLFYRKWKVDEGLFRIMVG